MPWREVSVIEQRREFVRLASLEEANVLELCRRFGVSPDVGYKWLRRYLAGDTELADRSRRPHTSPGCSDAATEAAVLSVRDTHPAWGARKIGRFLERQGQKPPSASTVHAILVRHGRVATGTSQSQARRNQTFRSPPQGIVGPGEFPPGNGGVHRHWQTRSRAPDSGPSQLRFGVGGGHQAWRGGASENAWPGVSSAAPR